MDRVEFSHNCWWLPDPTVYIASASDEDDVCSRRASTILGLELCISPSAIFRKQSFAVFGCKAGQHSDMSVWGQEAGELLYGKGCGGASWWQVNLSQQCALGPEGPIEPWGQQALHCHPTGGGCHRGSKTISVWRGAKRWGRVKLKAGLFNWMCWWRFYLFVLNHRMPAILKQNVACACYFTKLICVKWKESLKGISYSKCTGEKK